jgi:hypothetical protein
MTRRDPAAFLGCWFSMLFWVALAVIVAVYRWPL